jgi:hypothetical protein
MLMLLDVGQNTSLLTGLGETLQCFFERLIIPDPDSGHYIIDPLSWISSGLTAKPVFISMFFRNLR